MINSWSHNQYDLSPLQILYRVNFVVTGSQGICCCQPFLLLQHHCFSATMCTVSVLLCPAFSLKFKCGKGRESTIVASQDKILSFVMIQMKKGCLCGWSPRAKFAGKSPGAWRVSIYPRVVTASTCISFCSLQALLLQAAKETGMHYGPPKFTSSGSILKATTFCRAHKTLFANKILTAFYKMV